MITLVNEKPIKGMTIKSYFKLNAVSSSLQKNALAIRIESSHADFCMTCLCIYDTQGLCICTKYTKNSSGEYVKNHVPESTK